MKKSFVYFKTVRLEVLGETIHQRRKRLGHTLEEMEMITGISKKTLIKLEKGGDVRYTTLVAVLGVLGLGLTLSGENSSQLSEKIEDKEVDNEWF